MSRRDSYRARRRELARRQGWWLVGGAALLVVWGRFAARSLDPPGPAQLDWAANLVRSLEFQLGCGVALLLVGSLIRRAWAQAAVATVLVALTVAAPLAHGLGGVEPASVDDLRDFRVLSINVLVHNTNVGATARRIEATDADIVLVQEYGKAWAHRLPDALDGWSLLAAEPREDSFGVAAFVRDGEEQTYRGEVFTIGEFDLPQLRIEHDAGDARFVMYGIHVQPPISARGFRLAAEEVRDLRRRVEREDDPVFVAGDFNAVGGSAIDREMKRAGLHDAWDERGRGPGWTWPRNGILRFVPGVRIDHLYADEQWVVQRVRRLGSASSDHRPLLVDLQLRED